MINNRSFFRELQAGGTQIRHSIRGRERSLISTEGRTFSRVYRIEGSQLVEKCIRPGIAIRTQSESFKTAHERLGGIAAKTYIFKNRVIQEYTDQLACTEREKGLLFRTDGSEGERLVREYFALIPKFWARGVFDIDPGIHNFGVNLAGDLVGFDFDMMQTLPPGAYAMGNLETNLLIKVVCNGLAFIPQRLRGLYSELCSEFQETVSREFSCSDPSMKTSLWMRDIGIHHDPKHRLAYPHPFPLEKFTAWKRIQTEKASDYSV